MTHKGIFTGITLLCGGVALQQNAYDIRTNWKSIAVMKAKKIKGLWCASENQQNLRVEVFKTQGITDSQDIIDNVIPTYIDLQRNTVLLTALRMALIIKISKVKHIILKSTYEKTTPVKLGRYTSVGHGGHKGPRNNSVADNVQYDETVFISNLKVIDINYGVQLGQMLYINYANIYQLFADELETREINSYTKGTKSDFEWNIWYFLNQLQNAVTIQNTKYKLQYNDKANYNKKLCDQIMQLTLDYFEGIDNNPVINTDEMLTPGTSTPSKPSEPIKETSNSGKRNATDMKTEENTDEMLMPGTSTPSKPSKPIKETSKSGKRNATDMKTEENDKMYKQVQNINRRLDERLFTISKKPRIEVESPGGKKVKSPDQESTGTTEIFESPSSYFSTPRPEPSGNKTGKTDETDETDQPTSSSPSSPSDLRLRF